VKICPYSGASGSFIFEERKLGRCCTQLAASLEVKVKIHVLGLLDAFISGKGYLLKNIIVNVGVQIRIMFFHCNTNVCTLSKQNSSLRTVARIKEQLIQPHTKPFGEEKRKNKKTVNSTTN
jgi:hypothetical protein